MSIQVRFSDDDWQRIDRDWRAWWAGELERPTVVLESWDSPHGAPPPATAQFATQFSNETPLDPILDFFQTQLESTRYFGDAWPMWWPNFGPGIMAGFLGATVKAAPDTVWFEPSAPRAISEIKPAYDAENFWWRRIYDLTAAAVERWDNRAHVGLTDLGGNLDILASLRTTQKLATDLYDDPDEVLRLVHTVSDLWSRYYDELCELIRPVGRGTACWARLWSPARTYMLQSDFSYMISPAMFERFVMPDLTAQCARLDHAFYHLDGKGELPHLDMLLSIEGLRGIQWIPGAGQPPPEAWLPVLARIRARGKLCQVMVSPQGARTIVRELGGEGFAFCILGYLDADEAPRFLDTLAREDIGATTSDFYLTQPLMDATEEAPPPPAIRQRQDALLDELYGAILDGREEMVAALTRSALAADLTPEELLYDAMIPALEEVGRLFEMGSIFVPEMLIAARAMEQGMDALRPLIRESGLEPLGIFVMGTVAGDIHDIGKNLVNIMLEGAGFRVIDLGVNVPPEAFIAAIASHQPDIVGISAFLTTTLPALDSTIAAIHDAGMRNQVKVIVGGAPVNEAYAQRIGADGFASDASKAVRLAKQLLSQVT